MKISNVAIIGLGTMGQGICQLLITNGYLVTVVDVSSEVVRSGIKGVSNRLDYAVEKKKLSMDERDIALSRIFPKDLDELGDEDLIIECVSEDLSLKRAILERLDEIVGPQTIFASNTSSFTVSELSHGLQKNRILLGLHFFNPVWALPLVELVLPGNIAEDVKDSVKTFLNHNGRLIIETNDSPGFIVNRILFAMIAESIRLLESGVASINDIDAAMKAGARLPIGPFELMDLIGLDVTAEILENLGNRLNDDSFRKSSKFLKPMIDGGTLGRKNGRGFYEY